MKSRLLVLMSIGAGFALGGAAFAETPQPDAAGVEFFEKHVRPVLVESCYSCHSTQAKRVKGSLYLDSKQGVSKGGDSGASIVPGDPDNSLFVKAIRYADEELQMPPKEKLPAEKIALIEEWVKMGAPYPESATAQPAADPNAHLDIEKMRSFWSFQPPKEQPVPNVKNRQWAKTPIDQFILQKLEENGLSPSEPADKRTLIRRATFDLIGLPPTPEEVDAFVKDDSPDAFAKVIDRLLASPHYGERWGRYWLDIARYADSKGYVFEEERRYPYAYTYRDWVIRAFNEDMPYDQFLTYQIAADQIVGAGHAPASSGKEGDPWVAPTEHLAALGFLTLGRRFLNNQPDIIDDRIDVVTRGTLGFTVACARCHDHKYDPVPIKDYYSLYGIFASSNEPRDLPLLGGKKTPENEAFEKELAKIEGELQNYLKERHKEKFVQLRTAKGIEDHLITIHEAGDKSGRELGGVAQKRDLSGRMVERWRTFLKERASQHDPVFAPWHALAAVPEGEFAARASELIATFATPDPAKRINKPVAQALKDNPPKNVAELAARYGAVLAAADKAEAHADSEQEELRQILRGEKSPVIFAAAEVEQFLRRDERTRVRDIRKRSESLQASHPGAPARAMALVDNPAPTEPVVFIRGNPGNHGDKVPRQFLEILSNGDRKPFTQGSGRLELAKAIVSRDNPLTARVIVNRVWLWHFGHGLVRTPSDFGTRGEPPTHPELLDHLAVRFMNEGWSIKKLHRLIMLSAVYQQDSSPIANPKSQIANREDPENRLLWRMNRRRLDFEAMRDSLLFASARLDKKQFGRAVDIINQPFNPRRTIYGYIDRQNLPGMFRAFDFASPDQHSPQRFATTVPQQALFMINSPFVIEQARHVVKRPDIAAAESSQRITLLYRTLFGRDPAPDEVRAGIAFVESERAANETREDSKDAPRLDPWEKYSQVLLVSNEFMFID